MQGPLASRLFRITFQAAGIYNLLFGLWAAIFPHHFFQLMNIPSPRYPAIWACVGMVVGLYGILYLYVAQRLDDGWLIIFIGWLGKLLGCFGMAWTISDEWPLRICMLTLCNDFIWLLPFSLYLLRGTRLAERLVDSAAMTSAVVHLLALIATALLLQGGLLSEPEAAARLRYIGDQWGAWFAGWGLWMLSALTLVAFYAWWASRLRQSSLVTWAVVLGAMGMACDLGGEFLAVFVTGDLALAAVESATFSMPPSFLTLERANTIFSPLLANSLYTVAGIMLMCQTESLPQAIRTLMKVTWVAGGVMTVAAIFNYGPGLVISTLFLFPTLIAWQAWMGLRWRSECNA
jgi:hypothetical protein